MKSILLIGLGRFGKHVARKLSALNHQVMAVDSDEERVNAVLAGDPEPEPPTLNRRMAAMRAQIYEMCEEKGEWAAMPQARSQAMHYMKGLKGAASLRRYCSMLEHFPDVDRLIDAAYRLQQ